MAEHTIKQFGAELEFVRSRFLLMGGTVETMINDAVEALSSGDMALLDRVREREKEVNRFEIEIDERISLLLVRHQPTAVDLRTLVAISKMLTDMERSGDEADKMASTIRRMYGGGYAMPPVDLRNMGGKVAAMLRKMLDAFARFDAVSAAAVVRSDKEVDREWKANLRQLITYMMEDPRTISQAIDLIFMSRALERVGDHAKNMAERVIYMVRGADVRHTGVTHADRQARGADENPGAGPGLAARAEEEDAGKDE
jgi:phosphate transport system protein